MRVHGGVNIGVQRQSATTRVRCSAHVLASLVAVCLVVLGCDARGPAADAPPPAANETAVAAPPPAQPPPAQPPVPEAPLSGTWWALSRSLPYLAFQLELAPAPAAGQYIGTAVAFDWRDTRDARELSRPSRPVEVRGHWNAATQSGEISGPMPMVGADGHPNGYNGQWRLADLSISTGSNGWRFAGLLHQSKLTEPAGAPLALERSFRTWGTEAPP